MDKRISKTKNAIKEAFLYLNKRKPIHKITIKELCETAYINKSTFYTHYQDIYDLRDTLREEALMMIVASIPNDKEYNWNNPVEFTREVTLAFNKHQNLITSLFSQEDFSKLGFQLEKIIKTVIFNKHPHLQQDAKLNIILSYCIQGAFHAQVNNFDVPFDTLFDTIDTIVKTLEPLFYNM